MYRIWLKEVEGDNGSGKWWKKFQYVEDAVEKTDEVA